MKNRKVLFFLPSLKGGGAQQVAFRLAVYLSEKRGCNVTVLTLNTLNAKDYFVSKNIIVHSLDVKAARNSFFKVNSFLGTHKFDIILSFNRQLSIILILLRKFSIRKFPVIISRNITILSMAREIETSFWHKYIVYSFVKFFYRQSDLFISQSKAMTDDLVNNFYIKKDKVFTISNPVQIKDSNFNASKNSNLKSQILYVGRLEKVKNLFFLIESFSFYKEMCVDCHLHIVGEGSLEHDLRKYVKEMNLLQYVSFHGYTREINEFYKSASVVVSTSYYEGFPNVLIEANSFGVPVVVKNSFSGANDIVVQGLNGYLIDTDSPSVFANWIDRCLTSNLDKKTIVNSTKRFDIDLIGEKYCKVLGCC